MPGYYPLSLRVTGRKCVVIGGGEVAERKVAGLVEQGAQVRVISPVITPGLRRLAEGGKIQVEDREYRRGDLKGALLAIAATDDVEVNREVAREGEEKKVLVNVVDSPELSGFIVPSLVQRGELMVAISTSGHSPALARKIRSELESYFSPEYALLPSLLAEVRQELKREGKEVENETWQEILNIPALLNILRVEGWEVAKKTVLAALLKESIATMAICRGKEDGTYCRRSKS